MKRTLSAFMTTLMLSTSLMAGTQDVVPKSSFYHGSPYVRVTKLAKNRVSFERCLKGYEAGGCDQIGPKKSYSVKQLQAQRTVENWQIAGAVGADLVAIVALIYGGAAVGAAVGTAAVGGNGAVLYGAGAGAGVGATLSGVIDIINPYEQTKQAQTLNTDILEDKKVQIKNMEVFIERLELVLNKL